MGLFRLTGDSAGSREAIELRGSGVGHCGVFGVAMLRAVWDHRVVFTAVSSTAA